MKVYHLLLTLLCCPLSSLAQSTLDGRIIQAPGEGLGFANVLLLSKVDSSLVKGTVTDEEGYFQLVVPEKKPYTISVSMIGYETIFIDYSHDDEDENAVQLDPVLLREAANVLETAVVRAKKPLYEQQIDRTTINVQNSIVSAGSSALKILESAPGLDIDRSNNLISLLGKQGVIVLINGKRSRIDGASLLQMLDGISSASIQKIELITTPPASFDAEGDAGIINIVLAKNLSQGWQLGYNLFTAYGLRPKWGMGANISYNKDKFSLFGDWSTTNNYVQDRTQIRRSNVFEGVVNSMDIDSERPAYSGMHRGEIGADYALTSQTDIGLKMAGYISHWSLDARTSTTLATEGEPNLFSRLRSQEINHWTHWMLNAHINHRFEKGGELSLDLDYLNYLDDNPTDYSEEVRTADGQLVEDRQFLSRKETPLNFKVGKLDYRREMGELWQLEAGLKATHSSFTNDIALANLTKEEWVFQEDFTNVFDLEEKIYAAYLSTNGKWGERLSTKLGLRYEHYDYALGDQDNDRLVADRFGRLFPSLFISYDQDESHRIQLAYNERITRPSFDVLAPAFFFFGPQTILGGNPGLRSTISKSLKLEYKYNSFLLSFQYTDYDNPMTWGHPVLNGEDNSIVLRPENMNDQKLFTATVSTSWQIKPWWSSRYNVTYFWQSAEPIFEGQVFRRKGQYAFANTNHNFTLPMGLELECSAWLRSASIYGVMEIPLRYALNVGIQKKLSDRHQLSINLSDIFNTGSFFGTRLDETDLGIDYEYRYQLEGRVLRLSFSSTLGRGKAESKKNRQTGSSEEQNRMN